jgi:iron complex transport system substrate-binding protein
MRKGAVAMQAVPLLLVLFLMGPLQSMGADYPLTITDSAGREIALPMPVERIIVLNSDAAEAVVMLGAADKVVGVSDTVQKKGYYFPTLKGKQSVGKWNTPDYEMIGEIAKGSEDAVVPDIIVIGYTYPDKPYGIFSVAKSLAPFGNITAVGLDFFKPENMTREVQLLGQILGKEAEAQDYIDWYNSRSSQVEQAVEGKNKPKVFVEWSTTGDLSTLGPGSGFDQVLKMANGFNVAKNLKDAYPKVGWEWVVTQSPEVIIKRQTQPSDQKEMGWKGGISQDTTRLKALRNEILGRAGTSALPAAKSDRIYVVDWDVMNGLDQVVGLTYLAEMLHPEADLNPEEVHGEYLQRLGLEYPAGRVFVYP